MSASTPLFTRTDARLGTFAVRAMDPLTDAELLHSWVTHPKSAFYLLQEATLPEVEREFMGIASAEHHDAFIGLHEGRPAFLMERYDPAHVELDGLYAHQPGDVGMHFLCAPTNRPLHGFSLAVITTVMEMLFADERTERVVVEPDVRNTAVHALNEAVGFEIARTLDKPEKQAYLSFCTRARFHEVRGRTSRAPRTDATDAVPSSPEGLSA